MIKRRINIRMSGLGGQGVVTSAHVMAMAASKDGRQAISNPFFGAEKRMAPAEAYVRIGIDRIYDRGELVYPEVIEVFHPQVINQGKSYTMPFYSGIKRGGLVIINSDMELLTDEDKQRLADLEVAVYYVNATEIALEIANTELSTNMGMIGSVRQEICRIGRDRDPRPGDHEEICQEGTASGQEPGGREEGL
jgi:pyruvate ferredoxin oxidoreductase gamma subunit